MKPVEELRALMDELEQLIDPRRVAHAYHRAGAAYWIAAVRRDVSEALKMAEDEVRGADASGSSFAFSVSRTRLARALVDCGRYPDAERALSSAMVSSLDTVFAGIAIWQGLVRSLMLIRSGMRSSALAGLADALGRARETGAVGWLAWAWTDLPELLSIAWAEGIERDTVSRAIGLLGVSAPSVCEDWPSPIRVQVMGQLRVLRESSDLGTRGRKPPQKPLELLKAIVTLSPHATVENVAAALWPDADGHHAQANLSITLHRLRKLLGYEDAIAQVDGRLSLKRERCWVDAWTFEYLARMAMESGSMLRGEPCAYAERAVKMYDGHLLAAEYQPWTSESRERLRMLFHRLSLALATSYEKGGDTRQACELYERMLELDPAEETVYRRYMKCLGEAGHVPEARAVFLRCRRALSSLLATAPSSETVAVFLSLGGTPVGMDQVASKP